jgi:hypothetical protein
VAKRVLFAQPLVLAQKLRILRGLYMAKRNFAEVCAFEGLGQVSIGRGNDPLVCRKNFAIYFRGECLMPEFFRREKSASHANLSSNLKYFFNFAKITRILSRCWTVYYRTNYVSRRIMASAGTRVVHRFGAKQTRLSAAVLLLLLKIAPRQLGVDRIHAVVSARRFGWQQAALLFRQMDKGCPLPSSPLPAFPVLAPQLPPPSEKRARPVDDRPWDLPVDLARRIVVYTACFGERPYLPPIFGQPEGLRFLCFTDWPVLSLGWDVIPMERPVGGETFAAICPSRMMLKDAPDAEWSLFIEHERIQLGNLHNLFTRWLLPNDMALWKHSSASGWQELAEHLLLTGRRPAAAVMAQAAACEATGVSRDQAAYDTGMIWRRHVDTAIETRMSAWWALHEVEPEGDPALSLYRLRQETDLPVASLTLMPSSLGTAENNIFFAHMVPGRKALRPRLPAPAVRTRLLPISFIFAEQRRRSGITLLRARQLSQMVARSYPDRYDVSLCSDITSVRDHVVIVNRGAIEFNSLDRLAALQKRNIVSISDWLDLPIRAHANPVFDAHMTLSLPQAVELNRRFPKTPAFHVTHHVNPDIPDCTSPTDRLRTGYFGRLANTSRPDSLSDEIEMINVVDASFTAEDWARVAPLYNCHWIVRQLDALQEWKPFLKGFNAARCGAVVIVTKDDMNAIHYLGDDYPFYADSLAPEDLDTAWRRVAAAFGGPDWQKAQAIMRQVRARSSDRQVVVEFKAMLDEILA